MINTITKITETIKSQLNLLDVSIDPTIKYAICTDSFGTFKVPLRESQNKYTKPQIKKYKNRIYRVLSSEDRVKYIKKYITSKGILLRHIKISKDLKEIINTSKTLAGINIEIYCNGKHKYFKSNLISILKDKPIQCPKCLKEQQSKDTGPEYLYIINIKNIKDEDELFTKIGIASNMNMRYPNGIVHEGLYSVDEVLYQYKFPTRREALNAESSLHNQFKEYNRDDLGKFAGYTECFEQTILEDEDFLHSLNKYNEIKVEPHKF